MPEQHVPGELDIIHLAHVFIENIFIDIGNADTFTIKIPGPLSLVGRDSAAPEEVLRKIQCFVTHVLSHF